MPIKLNSLEETIETQIFRPNIHTKIGNKPICCALPNNNKSNPFINFFKMPIKLNSLE